MTTTHELEETMQDIEEVEELDRVKHAIECKDAMVALRSIERVRERRIAKRSVRIAIAAKLLDLSVPTTNKWADIGVLKEVDAVGVRRVTLNSVLTIRPLVLQLHELGKTRNLLEAVLHRLDDAELLEREDLRQSLDELRRGELVEI
jgi:hypothetical protein